MGYEYHIRPVPRDIDRILRAEPLFHRFLPEVATYEFRSPANPGAMPSAVCVIEDDRLYFCDNGGGRELLDRLAQHIENIVGLVSIEEL